MKNIHLVTPKELVSFITVVVVVVVVTIIRLIFRFLSIILCFVIYNLADIALFIYIDESYDGCLSSIVVIRNSCWCCLM